MSMGTPARLELIKQSAARRLERKNKRVAAGKKPTVGKWRSTGSRCFTVLGADAEQLEEIFKRALEDQPRDAARESKVKVAVQLFQKIQAEGEKDGDA